MKNENENKLLMIRKKITFFNYFSSIGFILYISANKTFLALKNMLKTYHKAFCRF